MYITYECISQCSSAGHYVTAACKQNEYLWPDRQCSIEGIYSLVKLRAKIVKHTQARLQVRVNLVWVQLGSFQKQLLHLRQQRAEMVVRKRYGKTDTDQRLKSLTVSTAQNK